MPLGSGGGALLRVGEGYAEILGGAQASVCVCVCGGLRGWREGLVDLAAESFGRLGEGCGGGAPLDAEDFGRCRRGVCHLEDSL